MKKKKKKGLFCQNIPYCINSIQTQTYLGPSKPLWYMISLYLYILFPSASGVLTWTCLQITLSHNCRVLFCKNECLGFELHEYSLLCSVWFLFSNWKRFTVDNYSHHWVQTNKRWTFWQLFTAKTQQRIISPSYIIYNPTILTNTLSMTIADHLIIEEA